MFKQNGVGGDAPAVDRKVQGPVMGPVFLFDLEVLAAAPCIVIARSGDDSAAPVPGVGDVLSEPFVCQTWFLTPLSPVGQHRAV